ncbi:MAG TPA: zinc metallopeptidase [Bacteroidia bacterium]|nr:zinc metallopeptidase [Bacteroidia bacterium]
MMYDPFLLLLSIVFMVVGLIVSSTLKSKFHEYSMDPLPNGMSGKDIAEKMLRDNGIYDVKVVSVEGELTDHYNPLTKTVNLSPNVYYGKHISAAAVAAHECGHAVQHATAYSMLMLRSQLVPVVQISSTIMNILVFGLMFGAAMVPSLLNTFLLIFIIGQSAITLFSLVTLPVEIDASRRALQWLNQTNILYGDKYNKAKDALKWAAYTYVVAALGAVATLLYYIWRFTQNNRD